MNQADQLRQLADTIEGNPNARGAIAAGFRLIADAMNPCTDCGQQQGAALDPADNPAAGTDPVSVHLADTATGPGLEQPAGGTDASKTGAGEGA